MRQREDRIAVVLLNLGGPRSLEEVPRFLKSMLGDPEVVDLPWPLRFPISHLVAALRTKKARARYERIGGKSPVVPSTIRMAAALEEALGQKYTVRAAFRHSEPSIRQVLTKLADTGVRELFALPVFPQFAGSTTGSCLGELRKAARALGLEFISFQSYPDTPKYIEALTADLPELNPDGTHVIFCAHGLPERHIVKGDPYVAHVTRTAQAAAARLPSGVPWSVAYQSRLGPGRWTEPELTNEIDRLGRQGTQTLCVVPVSFANENLETLYDLDIVAAESAKRAGISRFIRLPAVGEHPAFIDELAGFVRGRKDE